MFCDNVQAQERFGDLKCHKLAWLNCYLWSLPCVKMLTTNAPRLTSKPNSSSIAMMTSTWSKLSRPRSCVMWRFVDEYTCRCCIFILATLPWWNVNPRPTCRRIFCRKLCRRPALGRLFAPVKRVSTCELRDLEWRDAVNHITPHIIASVGVGGIYTTLCMGLPLEFMV